MSFWPREKPPKNDEKLYETDILLEVTTEFWCYNNVPEASPLWEPGPEGHKH